MSTCAGLADTEPEAFTPSYASFEVLQSMAMRYRQRPYLKLVDGTASDVYSAAALMYEMLTGDLPLDTAGMVFPKFSMPAEVQWQHRQPYVDLMPIYSLHADWVGLSPDCSLFA